MLEYNPLNERLKKQYEDALLHGAYKERRTVDAAWKDINLFERFTGSKNFTTFDMEQAKGFKRWLERQVNPKGEPLSLSTVRSTLANVREFFKWLATHPQCIRKVEGQAALYLRLSNNDERASRATRETPVPTMAQVRQTLEAMPYDTGIGKRNRAMVAFTALTGVRDAALISLKMKDINLETREIWQDPRHVKTKNRKGISTCFMPFDPLWEKIVTSWVIHARDALEFQADDPVFPKEAIANIPGKMKFESIGLSREHWANTTPVRDVFKMAFASAGLPYFRPHSFRKMLIIWTMENCDQYQFKAVSQNIGHEHAMVTYNSYGTLSLYDQRKAICGIKEGSADLQAVPTELLLAEMGRRAQK
jgi:integrase